MIISLRGTSGAGKTWLLHELKAHFHGKTTSIDNSNILEMKHRYKWLYCRPEQGTITVKALWDIVSKLSKHGDVIYESAFLRAGNGYIEKSSANLGRDMVFVHLDTPVEVCIERVRTRQEVSGRKHGEVKADNIARGDREIRNALEVLKQAGRRVVSLSWEHPLASMLGVLYYYHICNKVRPW